MYLYIFVGYGTRVKLGSYAVTHVLPHFWIFI